MNNRIKNIYFWIGLVGIFFASAGIDFQTLTSWNLLFKEILGILNNPVAIVSVIAGILGVWVDPTTKGLKDKE